MQKVDIAIVGGGIVGLATAYQLLKRHPQASVALLEKEAEVASHQTGHNSGVLHSGIYYKPGSLRAINCREGKRAMEDFCLQESIPFDLCGKIIVAVDESELPALNNIYERGQANGIACEIIGRSRIVELEPHSAGIQAIHVKEAGIVDYKQVARRMAERIQEAGGAIHTNALVTGIQAANGRVVIESTAITLAAGHLVNCAGLYCDRVTALGGQTPAAQIVPFRGEFYTLKPSAEHLCRALIYPVPDPKFPFLGAHFTKMIHGGVECGPNAVLAFAREGYRKRDVNPKELFEILSYPGFIRMAMKYWKTGFGEMWRSFSKRAFVTSLQRLIPAIGSQDIDHAPAGVRAQALGRDGTLVDDFLIQQTAQIINVGNAPSPAATASLNIGRMIVDRLDTQLSE